jgi:hypothetical protein
MPKGKAGSGEKSQPRGFLVKRDDGSWYVRQGQNWRRCEDLTIQVTVATTNVTGEGWCLAGVGAVRCLQRGAIVITA